MQLPASTVTSSPFDGVPAWTHSVVDPSEREPSTASQSDDSASVMAVQGKQLRKSGNVLDLIICLPCAEPRAHCWNNCRSGSKTT